MKNILNIAVEDGLKKLTTRKDIAQQFIVRRSHLSDIPAMVSLSKAKRLSYEKAQPQFCGCQLHN
jgi:DhnA family fructose-bisphosphate aldolase class Ia